MTDSGCRKYEISVINMHDYGQSYGHRYATSLTEALQIATDVVIGSIDWDASGCRYTQWCSFGEDAIVNSSELNEKVNFSGVKLVRERCNCEKCQEYLSQQ